MERSRSLEVDPLRQYVANVNEFIFRTEFYGGLVHSRRSGERYELDKPHATFFRALEMVGDLDVATELTQEMWESGRSDEVFCPDIDFLQSTNLIVPISQEEAPDRRALEPRAALEQLIAEREEAESRNYLRAPINLSLYPIMVCQLSCDFCYVTDEKWQKGTQPPERWINIMQQAKDAGTPFISFLGGDPSLYKGMPQLVRACDEIGIKATMTTNGVRMKEDLFSALTETNNITPVVSLQSLDDFHQRVTGKPVAQSTVNLEKLHAAGKQCNINMVYTEQSEKQILELVDYAEAQGAGKFTIGVFANITDSQMRVPPFSEYRRIHEMVKSYIEDRGYTIDFQTEGCQLYTAYPDLEYSPQTNYEQITLGCDAGQARCEIMHDGTILGCALLDKNKWGGLNVFETGYQEAWDQSQELKRVRSLKNRDKACNSGDCNFSKFCNGGCPAQNEKTYSDAEIAGDARCEIRQEIIKQHSLEEYLPKVKDTSILPMLK